MKNFTEIVYFGQRYPEFTHDDYLIARRVKRLWLKLQRLMIAEVNGEVAADIFLVQSRKIRVKLKALVNGTRFKIESQSDPRGRVITLFYETSQFYFEWI